ISSIGCAVFDLGPVEKLIPERIHATVGEFQECQELVLQSQWHRISLPNSLGREISRMEAHRPPQARTGSIFGKTGQVLAVLKKQKNNHRAHTGSLSLTCSALRRSTGPSR